MYDLIIIGAGPAGMTAGIYAARSGLKVLILEKETIGGQIASSPLVENYPGFKGSGAELSNNLFNQINELGCDFEIEEVLEIIPGKTKKIVTDYNQYETKTIIIATGAKHRRLEILNEDNFIGNGIHFCATCDGAFYKGQTVAVIGGGNTAVGDVLYLANICKKVYLLCRKNTLKCEKALKEKIEKLNNVEILYNTTINKIGENDISKLEIIRDNKIQKFTVDGIFLAIGQEPNTKIFDNLISKTDDGYINSDDCLTNQEGIFVAGDCRNKKIRQLTTATYDGTMAAMLAIDYIKRL